MLTVLLENIKLDGLQITVSNKSSEFSQKINNI